MLINARELLSDEQAITTDAISSVMDLLAQTILGAGAGNVQRDIGAGHPLYLHILVTTTFDTTEEDGTLDVTLESDSAVGLDSSATVHITIPQLAEAALVAGTWIAKGIPLPPGNYEKYLGVRYNVGSHAFTAGKVSAWLSTERFDNRAYVSGITTGIN